jgi:hypothetical protein
MTKLIAMLMLAAASALAASPLAAKEASLPKVMSGLWCGGETDEKGITTYGRPRGQMCDGTEQHLLSFKSRTYERDESICTYGAIKIRIDGSFTLTGSCESEGCRWHDRATGWFPGRFYPYAMNLKWEEVKCAS